VPNWAIYWDTDGLKIYSVTIKKLRIISTQPMVDFEILLFVVYKFLRHRHKTEFFLTVIYNNFLNSIKLTISDLGESMAVNRKPNEVRSPRNYISNLLTSNLNPPFRPGEPLRSLSSFLSIIF
jgi:hypothetical protein